MLFKFLFLHFTLECLIILFYRTPLVAASVKYMLGIIHLERTQNFSKNYFVPPDTHMLVCVSRENLFVYWKNLMNVPNVKGSRPEAFFKKRCS